MGIDTFFNRIRQNLIDLISRELTDWVQQGYKRMHGLGLGQSIKTE